MGNQDPLVAYQREGFAMFGKLMDGIDDDYLRYVFHVQVLAEPAAEPDLDRASYMAADDPVQGDGGIGGRVRRGHPGGDRGGRGRRRRGGNGAGRGDQPAAEDGETQAAHREVRAREDRTERPVLVREREEVQALPRRQLRWPPTAPGRGAGEPERVDIPAALASLTERLGEAERFLGADGSPSAGPSWRRRPRSPGCGTIPTTPGR